MEAANAFVVLITIAIAIAIIPRIISSLLVSLVSSPRCSFASFSFSFRSFAVSRLQAQWGPIVVEADKITVNVEGNILSNIISTVFPSSPSSPLLLSLSFSSCSLSLSSASDAPPPQWLPGLVQRINTCSAESLQAFGLEFSGVFIDGQRVFSARSVSSPAFSLRALSCSLALAAGDKASGQEEGMKVNVTCGCDRMSIQDLSAASSCYSSCLSACRILLCWFLVDARSLAATGTSKIEELEIFCPSSSPSQSPLIFSLSRVTCCSSPLSLECSSFSLLAAASLADNAPRLLLAHTKPEQDPHESPLAVPSVFDSSTHCGVYVSYSSSSLSVRLHRVLAVAPLAAVASAAAMSHQLFADANQHINWSITHSSLYIWSGLCLAHVAVDSATMERTNRQPEGRQFTVAADGLAMSMFVAENNSTTTFDEFSPLRPPALTFFSVFSGLAPRLAIRSPSECLFIDLLLSPCAITFDTKLLSAATILSSLMPEFPPLDFSLSCGLLSGHVDANGQRVATVELHGVRIHALFNKPPHVHAEEANAQLHASEGRLFVFVSSTGGPSPALPLASCGAVALAFDFARPRIFSELLFKAPVTLAINEEHARAFAGADFLSSLDHIDEAFERLLSESALEASFACKASELMVRMSRGQSPVAALSVSSAAFFCRASSIGGPVDFALTLTAEQLALSQPANGPEHVTFPFADGPAPLIAIGDGNELDGHPPLLHVSLAVGADGEGASAAVRVADLAVAYEEEPVADITAFIALFEVGPRLTAFIHTGPSLALSFDLANCSFTCRLIDFDSCECARRLRVRADGLALATALPLDMAHMLEAQVEGAAAALVESSDDSAPLAWTDLDHRELSPQSRPPSVSPSVARLLEEVDEPPSPSARGRSLTDASSRSVSVSRASHDYGAGPVSVAYSDERPRLASVEAELRAVREALAASQQQEHDMRRQLADSEEERRSLVSRLSAHIGCTAAGESARLVAAADERLQAQQTAHNAQQKAMAAELRNVQREAEVQITRLIDSAQVEQDKLMRVQAAHRLLREAAAKLGADLAESKRENQNIKAKIQQAEEGRMKSERQLEEAKRAWAVERDSLLSFHSRLLGGLASFQRSAVAQAASAVARSRRLDERITLSEEFLNNFERLKEEYLLLLSERDGLRVLAARHRAELAAVTRCHLEEIIEHWPGKENHRINSIDNLN